MFWSHDLRAFSSFRFPFVSWLDSPLGLSSCCFNLRSHYCSIRNSITLQTGQTSGHGVCQYPTPVCGLPSACCFKERFYRFPLTVFTETVCLLSSRKSKPDTHVKLRKDYISENRALIGLDDIARLAIQTDLPKIFKNFASSNTGKEFLIMNGQLAEADVAYQGIYAKAKSSIYVIDDYIGIKSIMHLRNVNPNVEVTVFSDNKQSHLRLGDLNDFKYYLNP